jgi:hypothetical protein
MIKLSDYDILRQFSDAARACLNRVESEIDTTLREHGEALWLKRDIEHSEIIKALIFRYRQEGWLVTEGMYDDKGILIPCITIKHPYES